VNLAFITQWSHPKGGLGTAALLYSASVFKPRAPARWSTMTTKTLDRLVSPSAVPAGVLTAIDLRVQGTQHPPVLDTRRRQSNRLQCSFDDRQNLDRRAGAAVVLHCA
jgi:hypothetical protein